MIRIIIIHGWGDDHSSSWYPWAKVQLERKGYEVIVPDMPDSDNPNIEKWVNELSKTIGTPDKNTYLIGHSIGCQTILRYLEKINTPIGGALFVAGWFYLENITKAKELKIARPWLNIPIDLKKVKKNLSKSVLIISSNDPFGAYDKNKKEFGKFCSYIYTIPNAEHITELVQPSIITQFEKLVHDNLFLE
jgi:hypothetical protein